MVSSARRAALRVLRETRTGRRAEDALGEVREELDERDRAWVHRVAYGTLRLRGRIDHLLGALVHRGLERVDPELVDVLRMATYQILEMDAVPPYAAVSQAVEQARELAGEGAAGFVNGVLRAVERRGSDRELFPDPVEDPAAHLAAWGSHPRWLVERWLRRWDVEHVRALVAAGNAEPPLFLRPVGVGVEEALRLLEERGIAADGVGRGTGCLRLAASGEVAEALAAVPSVVQDAAAALVVVFAAAPPGVTVADLCAAPGGKALGLAGEGRTVVAGDRSAGRLGRVVENARRTGRSVRPVVCDAARPPLRDAGIVLLDVPCTGTGTLRRNPELRWRLEPDDPRELAGMQRTLLAGAARVVSPGGLLVYSTCTLEPEENEDVVNAFLAEHSGFHRADPGPVPGEFIDERGDLRVMPGAHGFDGAYAARLRRAGGDDR